MLISYKEANTYLAEFYDYFYQSSGHLSCKLGNYTQIKMHYIFFLAEESSTLFSYIEAELSLVTGRGIC